jgi:hypothetical protein
VGSEHGVVTFVDDTCVEHIVTRKLSIPWHGLEFFHWRHDHDAPDCPLGNTEVNFELALIVQFILVLNSNGMQLLQLSDTNVLP